VLHRFAYLAKGVGDGDHHRAASTSFTSALSKKSDGGLEDCLPAPSYVALIYHRHRHFPYPRRVRESHVPSPQSPLSVSSQPGALVLKPTLPGRSSLRSYPINPCVFCKGGLFVTLLRGQFALQFPLAQAVSNLIAASARSRAFAPASVPSIPPVCNSDHKD